MHPLESAHENETRAVFTTLGMFIIDEFRFDEPLTQIPDQIGGGGTYAATAAAMFLPPSKVGMIIDRGSDWSPDWQRQLNLYGDIWVYRDDNTRLTTKVSEIYPSMHDLRSKQLNRHERLIAERREALSI